GLRYDISMLPEPIPMVRLESVTSPRLMSFRSYWMLRPARVSISRYLGLTTQLLTAHASATTSMSRILLMLMCLPSAISCGVGKAKPSILAPVADGPFSSSLTLLVRSPDARFQSDVAPADLGIHRRLSVTPAGHATGLHGRLATRVSPNRLPMLGLGIRARALR